MERDPERTGVLAVCEELGIGFVLWGPVGMGCLAGTMDARARLDPETDPRAGLDRFSPGNLAADRPIIDRLARFADERDATPAQVSLARLLALKPWIVPIPGTRDPARLGESPGSARVRLTADEPRETDGAVSRVGVHGGRMNEEQTRVVDRTA